MSKRKYKIFTEEEKEFIFENNHMKTAKEVMELFNKHFNESITEKQIKSFRNRYKLKSGLTGRFEKGHVSFNKGLRQTDFMTPEAIERTKATRFKKGDKPANHRKVGSERITVDGYIEIKVEEPDKWELKHRVVWEKANGLIPKNHLVIFADGDKTNLELDNLILISKRENAILNKRGLRYDNKETTELGITLANLILKTSEIKRGD